MNEIEIQRKYYASTAGEYDASHLHEAQVIALATGLMTSAIDMLGVESVLDIGSGTGRGIRALMKSRPDLRIVGIEPVKELRAIGHANGIPPECLIDGDATALPYADGQFDLVCEFATLHHVPRPDLAVKEMLRVARKAVFICDSNNFGQGGLWSRAVKQTLNSLGLWKFADFIKTKGKGYLISEGDGLYYSYSVFNNLPAIRSQCSRLHFMNTDDSNPNLYRTASGVALLGIKK